MFAKALAGPLSCMGLHYGWLVVAVTFLVALTTAGAVGVPGALILPLTKEFGRGRRNVPRGLRDRVADRRQEAGAGGATTPRFHASHVIALLHGQVRANAKHSSDQAR